MMLRVLAFIILSFFFTAPLLSFVISHMARGSYLYKSFILSVEKYFYILELWTVGQEIEQHWPLQPDSFSDRQQSLSRAGGAPSLGRAHHAGCSATSQREVASWPSNVITLWSGLSIPLVNIDTQYSTPDETSFCRWYTPCVRRECLVFWPCLAREISSITSAFYTCSQSWSDWVQLHTAASVSHSSHLGAYDVAVSTEKETLKWALTVERAFTV